MYMQFCCWCIHELFFRLGTGKIDCVENYRNLSQYPVQKGKTVSMLGLAVVIPVPMNYCMIMTETWCLELERERWAYPPTHQTIAVMLKLS